MDYELKQGSVLLLPPLQVMLSEQNFTLNKRKSTEELAAFRQSAYKCEPPHGDKRKYSAARIRSKLSSHSRDIPFPLNWAMYRNDGWTRLSRWSFLTLITLWNAGTPPAEPSERAKLHHPSVTAPRRLAAVRHREHQECPWETSRLQRVHRRSPWTNSARGFLFRSWPGIT